VIGVDVLLDERLYCLVHPYIRTGFAVVGFIIIMRFKRLYYVELILLILIKLLSIIVLVDQLDELDAKQAG